MTRLQTPKASAVEYLGIDSNQSLLRCRFLTNVERPEVLIGLDGRPGEGIAYVPARAAKANTDLPWSIEFAVPVCFELRVWFEGELLEFSRDTGKQSKIDSDFLGRVSKAREDLVGSRYRRGLRTLTARTVGALKRRWR